MTSAAATAVDFHAYFQPPVFLEHLRRRGGYPRVERVGEQDVVFTAPGTGRPIRPSQTDLDARVAGMDEAGIGTQILRLQNVGGIDAFELAEAADMARAVNEQLRDIAARYPRRFVPFAAVPLQDPRRAIEEARHAVLHLGHRGVGVSCHLDGVGLDDPRYFEFLQAVEALGVPLLVLPNHPPLLAGKLAPYGWLAGAFGFQVDLSWSVLRLLAGGVVDRLPALQVIVANLGGVLTSITERLDEYWHRVHTGDPSLAQQPSQALRRFHYETASADPRAIAVAAELFGADRLLFGSDFPSFAMDRGMRNVRDSGLAPLDIDAVLHGNAARLFAGPDDENKNKTREN